MNDYYGQVMRQLEMVGMELGDIRKMAGIVVDTLLAGGNVYFYSRYPESLAYEATGRRGGFAFLKGSVRRQNSGNLQRLRDHGHISARGRNRPEKS